MQLKNLLSNNYHSPPLYTPFPGWIRLSARLGNNNQTGPYDGFYASSDNGKIIFADFKQARTLTNVLTGDVMGEGIGGALLSKLYSVLSVDSNLYTKVNLVHIANPDGSNNYAPDETGESIYLQSIYMPGYEEEFWKYAFRESYHAHYLKLINLAETNFLNFVSNELFNYCELERQHLKDKLSNLQTRLATLPQYEYPSIDVEATILQNDLAATQSKLNDINRLFPVTVTKSNAINYLMTTLQNNKQNIASALAAAKIVKMEHSSLSLDSDEKLIISNAIKNNPTFLREFASLVAPRILVGDFDVHSGNFGIAHSVDQEGKSEKHLVAMNYNSACANLVSKLNPFQAFDTRHPGSFHEATGLDIDSYDKNYFIEYSKEVRSSLPMAETFLELSNINKTRLSKMINDSVNEQLFYDGEKREKCKYGSKILQEFCTRIGMNS